MPKNKFKVVAWLLVYMMMFACYGSIMPKSATIQATVMAVHVTYYVDSVGGNDANDGTTEATPWQTLNKVSSVTFAPGDRILFKAGSEPTGLSIPSAPVTIGTYGHFPR